MKSEVFFVKSLEKYLKECIQKIIRFPESLKSGKRFVNIKLTPREILGAFLICLVVRYISQQDWTLARDTQGGDGILWCRDKDRYSEVILLEQVYVRLRPKGFNALEIANKINEQIQKKIKKGKEYAKNRHLIVFLDVEGVLDHKKIKKYVENINERFDSYWLFTPGNNLDYFVFLLKAANDQSAAYKVVINNDFRSWIVKKIGNL